jgi:hypothetical protein
MLECGGFAPLDNCNVSSVFLKFFSKHTVCVSPGRPLPGTSAYMMGVQPFRLPLRSELLCFVLVFFHFCSLT